MSKKRVAVTLRKPQASADIETFVASEPAASVAAAPAPASPPRASVAEAALQHAARAYREVTLYLPSDVARALSLYCMDKNLDMNRVVAEAVQKHLSPDTPLEAAEPRWQAVVEELVRTYRSKLGSWLARPRSMFSSRA